MGNARGGADKHRGVKPLAQLKCLLDEILCLLTVCRLKHRDLCKLCIVAVVLLVLRAVHLRIISSNNNKASLYSGIRNSKKRISCNIYPHMLHGRERPAAAD